MKLFITQVSLCCFYIWSFGASAAEEGLKCGLELSQHISESSSTVIPLTQLEERLNLRDSATLRISFPLKNIPTRTLNEEFQFIPADNADATHLAEVKAIAQKSINTIAYGSRDGLLRIAAAIDPKLKPSFEILGETLSPQKFKAPTTANRSSELSPAATTESFEELLKKNSGKVHPVFLVNKATFIFVVPGASLRVLNNEILGQFGIQRVTLAGNLPSGILAVDVLDDSTIYDANEVSFATQGAYAKLKKLDGITVGTSGTPTWNVSPMFQAAIEKCVAARCEVPVVVPTVSDSEILLLRNTYVNKLLKSMIAQYKATAGNESFTRANSLADSARAIAKKSLDAKAQERVEQTLRAANIGARDGAALNKWVDDGKGNGPALLNFAIIWKTLMRELDADLGAAEFSNKTVSQGIKIFKGL